jgi:hypothetical protein
MIETIEIAPYIFASELAKFLERHGIFEAPDLQELILEFLLPRKERGSV